MVLIYITAIVLANLSVAHFGPWVSPINAFLLIGLDLWIKMLALIVGAGIISFVLNPASMIISIASVVAFVCAGLVDAFVYQRLISKDWMIKSNASNASGAAVD